MSFIYYWKFLKVFTRFYYSSHMIIPQRLIIREKISKNPSFLKTKMLNVYAMLSSNFYWIYQLALLIVDGPDNVTIIPSSLPVIETSSFKLVCSASCIYKCQSYSWKYNDKWKTQRKHILNLHSLSREDSGKYECWVTDDFGTTNSEYYTLNVQCKSWFVNQSWRVVLAFYI